MSSVPTAHNRQPTADSPQFVAILLNPAPSMRRIALLLALFLTTTATAALSFGPPWITIEYPGNPFDREHHDAYLYVHTFHHNDAINTEPRGTAEGVLAGGQRRSIRLA